MSADPRIFVLAICDGDNGIVFIHECLPAAAVLVA